MLDPLVAIREPTRRNTPTPSNNAPLGRSAKFKNIPLQTKQTQKAIVSQRPRDRLDCLGSYTRGQFTAQTRPVRETHTRPRPTSPHTMSQVASNIGYGYRGRRCASSITDGSQAIRNVCWFRIAVPPQTPTRRAQTSTAHSNPLIQSTNGALCELVITHLTSKRP